MTSLELLIPYFCIALLTFLCPRDQRSARALRWAGCLGSILTFILSLLKSIEGNPSTALLPVSFTLLEIIHAFLGLACFIGVPRRVFERAEAPLLFVLQASILLMFSAETIVLFSSAFISSASLLSFFIVREANRHTVDPRRFERLHLYLLYRGISIVGFAIFVLCLLSESSFDFQTGSVSSLSFLGRVGLLVAITSSLGLFPFHTWLPTLLSAPRLNAFIPVAILQVGTALFFRFFVPLSPLLVTESIIFQVLAVVGLVYFSLLLFGETRLKKLAGYLVLTHLSLMILALSTPNGLLGMRLDAINILCASTGLVLIISMLTSRFGLYGVTHTSGLATAFPEMGICFLLCVLSLVGFPGTVGFVSEELLFKGGLEYRWLYIPPVIFAIALNGYSSFRLFAKVFYGAPSYPLSPSVSLSLREKAVLLMISIVLIVNGLAPTILLSHLHH